MPRRINVLAAQVLILLLAAAPAWPWGFPGHRIIAIIAEQRLSAGVRQKIRKLLMDGKYSLADISTCADRVRDTDRARPEDAMCRSLAGVVPSNNGAWHYIQIPAATHSKTLEPFCPRGECVTAKLAYFAKTLRTSTDPAELRQALLFMVHLAGDIHQPLHAVDRDCDKGGNSVWISLAAEGQEHSGVNLHQVWDTRELEFLMARYNVSDEHMIADALSASISSREAQEWARSTPEQMAWESNRIAVARVYADVPYQNFCGGRESARMETKLSLPYTEEGTRVVQIQLMKAGVRLAAMLESALGET